MCHLFLTIWSQIKSAVSFSRSFMRYEEITQVLALYEALTRFFIDRIDAMFSESAAFHARIWWWESCFTLTQTVTWKSWKYSTYLRLIKYLTSHTSCEDKSRKSQSKQSVWLVFQIIKRASKAKNSIIKFWYFWKISECLISLSNFLLSCMTLSAMYEEREKVCTVSHLSLWNLFL